MPSSNFSVRVKVDSVEARRALERGEEAVSSTFFIAFLRTKVVNYLKMRVESRFRAEGDDASGKWLPLQASTVKIRQSEGFPGAHPINVRTGDMQRVTHDSNGEIFDEGYSSTLVWPGEIDSGAIADKYRVAQAGGRQEGRRDTPPRPIVALGERDVRDILSMLDVELRLALNFGEADVMLAVGRRTS